MKISSHNKPVFDAAAAMLKGLFPQLAPETIFQRLTELDREPVSERPAADPRGYSPMEAARLLSLSRRTVYQHIADGRLTARKIGPRLVRIPRAEIEKKLKITG